MVGQEGFEMPLTPRGGVCLTNWTTEGFNKNPGVDVPANKTSGADHYIKNGFRWTV